MPSGRMSVTVEVSPNEVSTPGSIHSQILKSAPREGRRILAGGKPSGAATGLQVPKQLRAPAGAPDIAAIDPAPRPGRTIVMGVCHRWRRARFRSRLPPANFPCPFGAMALS